MINDHLKEWFGQKVEEYKPGAGYGLSIPRFGYSYDNEDGSPAEDLKAYLADPRTATVKALVFGMPGESGESFSEIIDILVDHAARLPALRGIFLGDIEQEENEMSWIEQGDIGRILAVAEAPILAQLEELDLSLGTMTDKGAEALIASEKVRGLKSLNLHRNYLTDATVARLQTLGPKVDVGAQEKPDDWDGEPHYYVAVGE